MQCSTDIVSLMEAHNDTDTRSRLLVRLFVFSDNRTRGSKFRRIRIQAITSFENMVYRTAYNAVACNDVGRYGLQSFESQEILSLYGLQPAALDFTEHRRLESPGG
jgi:hypothetical protein